MSFNPEKVKYNQRDIVNSLDALAARGLLYKSKDPSKYNPEAPFTQEVRDKLLTYFIGINRTPIHDIKRLRKPPAQEVIDFLKNIKEEDIRNWVNNEDSVFQFKGGDIDVLTEEDLQSRIEEDPTIDYDGERGTSQSPTERVSQRARKFLALLPRMKNGEREKSVTGISLFESANVISAKITKDLAGSLDYPSMVEKIKMLGQTDFQYKILYNMFGLDRDSELGQGLFQSLSGLQKLPILKVMDQDIKYVVVDVGDNKQGIKTKWLTQFRELVINPNEGIARIDENNNTLIDIDFLNKKLDELSDESNYAQTLGILEIFGIKLNQKTRDNIRENNIHVNVLNFKTILIAQKNNIKNGVLVTNNPWKKLLAYKFNKILEVESVYSEMKSSIMGYNINGDKVGVYSLSNYALTLRSALEGKSVHEEMSDIITRNITDPTLPKHLREKLLSGELKIEIFNLDGYATESDEASTSSLSNHQYINQQKIYWDKERTMEFPRTETGSSAWGFRFVKKDGKFATFYDKGTLYIEGHSKERNIEQTVDVFSEVLRSAVEKNNILKENYPDGIPFKNYSVFKNFGYLTEDLLAKLESYSVEEFDKEFNGAPISEEEFLNLSIVEREDLKLERKSSTEIYGQIKEYVESTLDEEIKIFGDKGIEITKDSLSSYQKYVLNTLIHQTYSNLLFYGDGNWFGKFFKRAKLAVSTGTQTDAVLFERSVNSAASIFGEVGASPFIKVAAFIDVYKPYNDEKLKNILGEAISSLDQFTEGVTINEGEELIIQVEKKGKIVNGINPNYLNTTNPKMKPFVMNTLTSILDGYQGVNVADGQSVIHQYGFS